MLTYLSRYRDMLLKNISFPFPKPDQSLIGFERAISRKADRALTQRMKENLANGKRAKDYQSFA